jgi:hypothetical protein
LVQEIEKSHQWCEYLKLPPSVAVLFWIQLDISKMKSSIRKINYHQPKPPKPTPRGTASSPKGGLLCGVALHFFCHGFCKPTHMHYFVFLKDKKKTNKCIPTHKQKPLPKKDGGKLNNIMWHYSIFYLRSCKHALPRKKSYNITLY